MMNLLAICLVLSSISASGVWSPNPEKNHNEGQDVIVKEGHRVVVVEYGDQGQHNTRVSISDRHGSIPPPDVEERVSSSKDLKEAAKDGVEGADNEKHGTKELICDAFGKCKRMISSTIGKGKEMASETVHQAEEVASEKLHDVEEKAKETMGKVKDKVSEKTQHLKDRAKETAEKGKERVKEATELGKTIGKDVAMNVSEEVETAEEEAKVRSKEAMENAKHVAGTVKEESHKGVKAIIRGVRKLIIHSSTLMVSPSLASAVSLMGFAVAFGMSVWVTFISSYVLARTMPRHQFAVVQSKIYPVYFRAMATSIAMAFLGHLLGHTKWPSPNTAEVLQGYNLLSALLLVLGNSLHVEPIARKVMFEKIRAEKEEGRGRGESPVEMTDALLPEPDTAEEPPHGSVRRRTVATPEEQPRGQVGRRVGNEPEIDELNMRLKKVNSFSSFLNILTLMALGWHLVYLNQRLCRPV